MPKILNLQLHELIILTLKFLFISLPFFILLGPFLSDLAISLSALLFLILLYILKKFSYLKNKFFLCFLFFYFFIVLLSLFSSNPLSSLESSLFYLRFGIFVLVMKFLISEDSIILKRFTINLMIAMILGILYGYIYYLGDFNSILFNNPYSRIPLPFTDEYILGSLFARLFPLFFCLYLYYFSDSRIQIWFLSFITVLADVLIYISGERTAFALISIAIILLIFCLPKFRYIRIISLFFSLIIITTITFFSSSVKERMIIKTIEDINENQLSIKQLDGNYQNPGLKSKQQFADSYENTEIKSQQQLDKIFENPRIIFDKYNLFSKAHNALANSAMNIYLDNNKFFGIGPKLFRYYCKQKEYIDRFGSQSCSTHPHHTFIQLLVETGIFGFAIILMLLLYASLKIINQVYVIVMQKTSNLTVVEVGAFTSLFISLCPIVPSGNFFNNWLSVIYFLPLVFIFYSKDLGLND